MITLLTRAYVRRTLGLVRAATLGIGLIYKIKKGLKIVALAEKNFNFQRH